MKRGLFLICLTFISCLSALDFYAYDDEIKDDFAPCILCTDSKNYEATIAFTKYWKITYWKNQAYLGRSLITARRHFGSYEEMTEEEAKEYWEILRIYLPALKKILGAMHFNVAYLMNQAYRDESPDPHFHWHVIPRYNSPCTFAGETFTDPDFGNSFDFSRKQYLEGKFRQEVITALQNELNVVYVDLYG